MRTTFPEGSRGGQGSPFARWRALMMALREGVWNDLWVTRHGALVKLDHPLLIPGLNTSNLLSTLITHNWLDGAETEYVVKLAYMPGRGGNSDVSAYVKRLEMLILIWWWWWCYDTGYLCQNQMFLRGSAADPVWSVDNNAGAGE